jgi:Leucine Rich repeat
MSLRPLMKNDAAAPALTSLTAMTMESRRNNRQVVACNLEVRHSPITMDTVAAVSSSATILRQARTEERSKQQKAKTVSTSMPSIASSQKDTSLAGILSHALDISVQACGEVLSKEKTTNIKHASIKNTFSVSGEALTLDFAGSLKHDAFSRGNVSTLHLSNMTITRASAPEIQSMLVTALYQNRFSLESVCLSKCQLGDDFAVQISNLISSEPNSLRSLDLSRNEITNRGAAALASAMESSNCGICELDISNNRLTAAGTLVFGRNLPAFHSLQVLRLADSEHLLPLKIFQQFCAAAEKNFVLHTLTLGSEDMDGSSTTEHQAASGTKEMDALLGYWWQEPVYTAVTDRIRFLLRLNYAGLTDMFQSSCSSVLSLRSLLDTVKPEKQLDACFRIIQHKPDLLAAFSAAEAGADIVNGGESPIALNDGRND